ncbi:HNH endonuclease [Lapidilactobacillus wuchangensis]|uniref:HNH endonuclease n=1 Tax=Lapidilactobacillus wuchangensis TaxID=2486001 RepID=UPI0013DE5057|nr:HNH endonuclease signature motif containing protein [Lapidilactobacillus wuchangensis]
MHLRCAYCQLDLNLHHYQASAEVVTSICDLCQSRSLKPAAFQNQQVAYFAAARKWLFLGLPTQLQSASQPVLQLTRQQRKACTSLLNSFDALPAAWQTTGRRQQFYQEVIRWQDQPDFELTGNVPVDLKRLGCDTTGLFDKNTLDYTTRARVREYYQHQCQYCGRYGDSVDHKNPVALSNDNRWENLTLSCRECNRLKGDMPYQLFVDWNQELQPLLRQLVASEQALQRLDEQQRQLQNQLAAQRHLTGEVTNPQLQAIRQQIKVVQGLRDGEDSDYQKLIQLRHDYIISKFQIWQLQQVAD